MFLTKDELLGTYDTQQQLHTSKYTVKMFADENIPVYRGCPNNGPCFCTGACQEITGYISKSKLDDFIQTNIEKP